MGLESQCIKKSACLPTFGEVAEAWAQTRASRGEQSVARSIGGPLTSSPVTARATAIHLANVVTSWKNTHAASTASTYRAILLLICKFADRLHGTDLQHQLPRVPRGQPRTLTSTEAEFNAMYRAAKPWMRAFLLLTRTLGLRRNEALRICPAHIERDGDLLSFRRKMDGTSTIPLTLELSALFAAHAGKPNTPIIDSIKGARVTADSVQDEWNRLRRTCPINPRLTPHDLRRTACKRVYDQTHDLRICQQLLGHRSIASTLRYIGAVDHGKLKTAILNTAPHPGIAIDAPHWPPLPVPRGRHAVSIDSLPLPTEVKQ